MLFGEREHFVHAGARHLLMFTFTDGLVNIVPLLNDIDASKELGVPHADDLRFSRWSDKRLWGL